MLRDVLMDYEKLGHMIMKFEMSHDLLSARLRVRKASGVIHSESQSLRTSDANGVNKSQSKGQKR